MINISRDRLKIVSEQCPKCRSNLINIENDGMRFCGECTAAWKKNKWRIDHCVVRKDITTFQSPHLYYTLEVIFEGGKKILMNVDGSAHCFEVLNKVKDMFSEWDNGDDNSETVIIEKTKEEPSSDNLEDNKYIEGVNRGFELAYEELKKTKSIIIQNNPNPESMSLTRDCALMALDMLEKDIVSTWNEMRMKPVEIK